MADHWIICNDFTLPIKQSMTINDTKCILFNNKRLMPQLLSFKSTKIELFDPFIAEDEKSIIWNDKFRQTYNNELITFDKNNGLKIHKLLLNSLKKIKNNSFHCNVSTTYFNNSEMQDINERDINFVIKNKNTIFCINHSNNYDIYQITTKLKDKPPLLKLIQNEHAQWNPSRTDGKCIQIDNILYLIGGWLDEIQDQSCEILSYIDMLNVNTMQWSKTHDLHLNVLNPQLCNIKNKILIIGGVEDSVGNDILLDTILIYDIKHKTIRKSSIILPFSGSEFSITTAKFNEEYLISWYYKEFHEKHSLFSNMPWYLLKIICNYFGCIIYLHLFKNEKHWKINTKHILHNKRKEKKIVNA